MTCNKLVSRPLKCHAGGRLLLLPRAHAQRVKQLSSVVVTKIARSRVLAICACCNYHELVDIGEKLVSVFVELNTAH